MVRRGHRVMADPPSEDSDGSDAAGSDYVIQIAAEHVHAAECDGDHGGVVVPPRQNGGKPLFQLGKFDKKYWTAQRVKDQPFVKLVDKRGKREYTIPINRVNKAL